MSENNFVVELPDAISVLQIIQQPVLAGSETDGLNAAPGISAIIPHAITEPHGITKGQRVCGTRGLKSDTKGVEKRHRELEKPHCQWCLSSRIT